MMSSFASGTHDALESVIILNCVFQFHSFHLAMKYKQRLSVSQLDLFVWFVWDTKKK
jgi:hypothetical protein